MFNILTLKLKQIKYSGDNLGREFSVNFTINGDPVEINFKLSCGETRSLDKVIYEKILEEKFVTLVIATEVSEIRERHIDLGTGTIKVKVSPKKGAIHKETLEVLVKGAGREKGKSASIVFILEASNETALRYIPDINNGWLTAKLQNKKVIALPQLLKYAKTWFRIGHEGSRFLHVGRRSLGCITVIDKEKWTDIYNHLIKSRKDLKNIGDVTVK